MKFLFGYAFIIAALAAVFVWAQHPWIGLAVFILGMPTAVKETEE